MKTKDVENAQSTNELKYSQRTYPVKNLLKKIKPE